jgi:hypothetical protein
VPPPSTAKVSGRPLEVPDFRKPADVTDSDVNYSESESRPEQDRQVRAKDIHQASMDVREGLMIMALGWVQYGGGARLRRCLEVDCTAA